MINVGRSDALDQLRSWLESGAALRCDLSFRRAAASLRSKVREISDDELRLASDDGASELTIRLTEATFGYKNPRDFPEERAEFARGLVIFLPPIAADGTQDFVALLKLRA
jgi:hypothetical protein